MDKGGVALMAQVPLAFEEPSGGARPSNSAAADPAAATPASPSAPPPGMARCAACRSFQLRRSAEPKSIDGWCTKFHVETWPEPIFACEGYVPADAAAIALHRRRGEVVQRLRADSSLRYAWDVENASPVGPAAIDVSVMLGIRYRDDELLTGVLRIPGDRWNMAAFLTSVGEMGMSPAGAAE
jgi:hypothetical protein